MLEARRPKETPYSIRSQSAYRRGLIGGGCRALPGFDRRSLASRPSNCFGSQLRWRFRGWRDVGWRAQPTELLGSGFRSSPARVGGIERARKSKIVLRWLSATAASAEEKNAARQEQHVRELRVGALRTELGRRNAELGELRIELVRRDAELGELRPSSADAMRSWK